MKGSRGLAAGEGRGTEGHRRLGPRARARARGCRPDEIQWFVQPGSGGQGASGGHRFSGGPERCPRGEASSRGPRQQCWGEGGGSGMQGRGAAKQGGAGTSPRGQFHVPPLPCCPSHPGTRRETAASLGTEMWPNSHTGRGSGMGTRDGREKRPRPSSGKPGPARGCSPSPRRGRRGGRCQEHFQTHTARVPPKYR